MKTPDSIHCRPGTTDAMQRLADENEALRAERDEALAQVERFREGIKKAHKEGRANAGDRAEGDFRWLMSTSRVLYDETPAQSLAHIRAAGAREALERAMADTGFSGTVVRVDVMRDIIEQMESGK